MVKQQLAGQLPCVIMPFGVTVPSVHQILSFDPLDVGIGAVLFLRLDKCGQKAFSLQMRGQRDVAGFAQGGIDVDEFNNALRTGVFPSGTFDDKRNVRGFFQQRVLSSEVVFSQMPPVVA